MAFLIADKHDCTFYIGAAGCLACAQDDAEEFGYRGGAAVAFGLMGMAEAIRTRLRALPDDADFDYEPFI